MIFFCTLSTIRISESLLATSAPFPSFNGPRIPFHSMEGRFPSVFALNTLDMGPYLCGADLAAERGQKRPALERPPRQECNAHGAVKRSQPIAKQQRCRKRKHVQRA